jgi:putative ABC transport system ATP-binding protein
VVITHNAAISAMADRVLRMADGTIRAVDVNSHRLTPAELAW